MRRWVLGEFGSEEALLAALRALRERGHRGLDAYAPFPVEGMEEALGLRPSPVPAVALVAGLGGATMGFVVQWFTNAVDWPLDVGGRPPFSAPAFIPITFESGVLAAALTLVATLLLLFGFPHVTHPVFQVDAFRSASVDGFWVSLTTEEDAEPALEALRQLGARNLAVVPEEVPP